MPSQTDRKFFLSSVQTRSNSKGIETKKDTSSKTALLSSSNRQSMITLNQDLSVTLQPRENKVFDTRPAEIKGNQAKIAASTAL